MPALTLGLQRSVGMDPSGLTRMFGLPDASRPAAPQGLDALSQMFGSAQLLQGVLQQASATSGVGAQVLRQMLPMMAGAVVASIVHVLLNQPQAAPAQARTSAPPPPVPFPFGPAWADMARAFLPAEAPAPKPTPNRRRRSRRGRLGHDPADAAHRGRGTGQQHPGDAGPVRDLLALQRNAGRCPRDARAAAPSEPQAPKAKRGYTPGRQRLTQAAGPERLLTGPIRGASLITGNRLDPVGGEMQQ